MTLTIPQHRDPVARAALIACALALCWLAITSALPAASAKEEPQVLVVVATPTLAPPMPTEAPAVVAPALAAPTAIPPTPQPFPTEAPPAVVAVPAPVQEEAPAVGERASDKAGPRDRKAAPVIRH